MLRLLAKKDEKYERKKSKKNGNNSKAKKKKWKERKKQTKKSQICAQEKLRVIDMPFIFRICFFFVQFQIS